MDKLVIYGPPGTGKTTRLMHMLEEELKVVHPEEIAFVSFTKKGTYEGVERAKEKFELKDADLPYFRTIHSMSFKALGLKRMDVVAREHYKRFSRVTGINFTGHYTDDFRCDNDIYLHAIAMEEHNPKLAFEMSKHLDDKKYKYIKFQYGAMKRQLGLIDFDDMLLKYVAEGKPLGVKVAFIDEAQDLTPLQWQVALKMFRNAERIIVAGDDDQAVYEWSGADVKKFMRFSKKSVVLEKSYRMPEKILALAKRVTRDIAVRKQKDFASNGEEGAVDTAASVVKAALKGGELVLARTNYLLKQLAAQLEREGVLYRFKGKLSVSSKTMHAIDEYERFAEGTLPESAIRKYSAFFNRVAPKLHWAHALDETPERSRYIELVRSRWGSRAPVVLETFHSCKGGESDRVILSTDMTSKVVRGMAEQRDAELRCLYVGMTRARKRLTVIAPNTKHHYHEKYFA